DLYFIIGGCLIQAFFLGSKKFQGESYRFLGNLIGPTIYSAVEFGMEGFSFFSSPHHLAYWGISLSIGLFQELKVKNSGFLADLFTMLEHVVRTCILAIMYGIFEAMTEEKYNSIGLFLSNSSHVFVTVVIILLGIVIGVTAVTGDRYLSLLQATAGQLRKYSEWFLGKEILSAAISDTDTLALQRRERTVIFMDIRGFTSWSENRTPETVVNMLNDYFERAEQIWVTSSVIKTKHTADEIMAIFPSELDAVGSAIRLNYEISDYLKPFNLTAGIGINSGYLVEGLIGSKEVKMYDIIGDTVNTGKRICDQARGGEILVSQTVFDTLKDSLIIGEPRFVAAKGKSEPLKVFPVTGLNI
ncbi:MAG: adenylate/guanylate cyclase domain-containing protein, partial [Proteobacteria bacterium]|nr:adenylate/guanylate cyclase domain-containing protein [Pseudomonadota bacterium]